MLNVINAVVRVSLDVHVWRFMNVVVPHYWRVLAEKVSILVIMWSWVSRRIKVYHPRGWNINIIITIHFLFFNFFLSLDHSIHRSLDGFSIVFGSFAFVNIGQTLRNYLFLLFFSFIVISYNQIIQKFSFLVFVLLNQVNMLRNVRLYYLSLKVFRLSFLLLETLIDMLTLLNWVNFFLAASSLL